jgi:hypothetical protein
MAEKKPAKGKVPNILTPDVPAISAKPRSLKDKFQPAPLTNNLGNDPENLSKIEEIRHLARQREAQAKTLGPNYKPEKNVESTANPVVSTEDGKITYSPSDLARKYSISNRLAQNTQEVVPGRKSAGRNNLYAPSGTIESQEVSFAPRQVASKINVVPEQKDARTGEVIPPFVTRGEPVMSKEVYAIPGERKSQPYFTPEQINNRSQLVKQQQQAIAATSSQSTSTSDDYLESRMRKHTPAESLPPLPTPKNTEKSDERVRGDSRGFRGFAPKPEMLTLTPEQIAKHGVDTVNRLMKTHDVHVQLKGQHIARLVNVDEELTHTPSGQQIKRFVPLNSEGMEMGPNALKPTRPSYLMEGEVQNPLYRHGVSLFNKYAPKSKRFPFGDNLDNVDPTSKANWVREHLRDKVVPALYPDNEAAAYKDIMNHPDKIVDVFEEHHTKQKAFESAHRKGGVLPTLPTGKLDPVTGEEKRRPPRSVHTLNREIQRLRNSNLPYTGPQLDDPEDVRRQRAADKQALRDSSDISGFSEQNTSPETVAQSPEEAKGSKMREAGRAPLEL